MIEVTDALRAAVAAAMGEGDGETTWYFDRQEPRVVVVRDGVCDAEDLDAAEVDRDEDRFEVVPPVLQIDEHTWLDEFIDETGEPRIAKALDTRKGAVARALKRIEQADPALLARWLAFRQARLMGQADEWLASL